MSVELDKEVIPVPEGAGQRSSQVYEGRELGRDLRSLPVGRSLACSRRARSVKRQLYNMRMDDGSPAYRHYVVLDIADRPGWSRVWRIRPGQPGEAGLLAEPDMTPPADRQRP